MSLAVGVGVRDSLFSLAHYLLADKYRTIAHNLPNQFSDRKSNKSAEKQKCRKIIHWILIVCNVGFPILASLFVFIFGIEVLKNHFHQAGHWVLVMITITSSLVGLVQMISGIILVQFVLKIRAFFKSRNEMDCINSRALLRHAIAFGLFLLTDIAYYVMWPIYTHFPRKPRVWSIYCIITLFWLGGSMISQLFLCTIYWQLGAKDEDTSCTRSQERTHSSFNYADVLVESTDTDWHTQARMWNVLIRKRPESERDTKRDYRVDTSGRSCRSKGLLPVDLTGKGRLRSGTEESVPLSLPSDYAGILE